MSRLHLLSLSLLLIGLSSCSRYYYKPNGVNAPMLADAQDLHITANVESGGDAANFQAAYSPINHLGIIGGFSTYSFKADNPDPATGNVDAAARLGEIGAGYYYATKDSRVRLVCDVYGGVGFGSMTSDVNMKAMRLFIQPGIGMRTQWFDCSFNLRMCDVSYSGLDANGHDNTYLQQQNLIDVTGSRRIDNTHYLFAEPSFTFRGGYKFIKLQAQYVLSAALSDVPWRYSGNTFTLGAHFQLEDLLKVVRANNQKPVNQN